MKSKMEKSIPESSAFYQGHPQQFFSSNKLLFEIKNNYTDPGAAARFNTSKLLPLFMKTLNYYITKSINPSGVTAHAGNTEIRVLRLIDSNNNDHNDASGIYTLSPQEAICTKKGCNEFFVLSNGKTCGHNNSDYWDQITFVAFCDICGKVIPLSKGTNLNKGCKICNAEKSKVILKWDNRGEISTYSVNCKNCGASEHLVFYQCYHDNMIPTDPEHRFRGVPARSGSVRHAVVSTIIDLYPDDEVKASGIKQFSDEFRIVFGGEISENHLALISVIEGLSKNVNFWKLKGVDFILDNYDLDSELRNDWTSDDWNKLMRGIVHSVAGTLKDDPQNQKVKEKYGVSIIKELLDNTKDVDTGMEFDEDAYCSIPISGDDPSIPKVTKLSNLGFHPRDLEALKMHFGLTDVSHISNTRMVQALLGWVSGSTRKKKIVFDPYMNEQKHIIMIRDYPSECISFKFDKGRLLDWLKNNDLLTNPKIEVNKISNYSAIINSDDNAKKHVFTLLHTFSHLMMQVADDYTGLDLQSYGELIDPVNAKVIIYSTSSINCGGLEEAFTTSLSFWLGRLEGLAEGCPQDPACMMDENGACNACSYLPEIVCCCFNEDLDRGTLIGGPRFKTGFLK